MFSQTEVYTSFVSYAYLVWVFPGPSQVTSSQKEYSIQENFLHFVFDKIYGYDIIILGGFAMLDPESINKPVFLCQGNVLVEEVVPGEVYILLEPLPSCGLKVGDKMPIEWSFVPANETARRLVENEPEDSFEDLSRICPPSTW